MLIKTLIPLLTSLHQVLADSTPQVQVQIQGHDVSSLPINDLSETDCLDSIDCGYFTHNNTSIKYHTLKTASPEWITPKCIWNHNSTVEYCLFTSTSFDNGRGISFLTTPDKAERILKLPAFTDPSVLENVNYEPRPSYEARKIPGKGIGLIANKTIHKGDLIFANTPVLVVEEYIFTEFEAKAQHVPLQRLAIDNLPEEAKQSFLNLHGHFGGDPYQDILNTNAFAVEGWPQDDKTGEIAYNACIPEISRMNHDCRPNAHYYFHWPTLTHNVHALRAISPGEELTISYIDPLQAIQQRKDYLHTSWGFHCDCSSCTAQPAIAAASDARVAEILDLQSRLSDTEVAFVNAPQMAELLVKLYEQERLLGPVADAYTFAAHEWNGVGDKWRAREYAYKGIESGLLYGGPLDFDVGDLTELLDDQRGHWSWHFREDWEDKSEN